MSKSVAGFSGNISGWDLEGKCKGDFSIQPKDDLKGRRNKMASVGFLLPWCVPLGTIQMIDEV